MACANKKMVCIIYDFINLACIILYVELLRTHCEITLVCSLLKVIDLFIKLL